MNCAHLFTDQAGVEYGKTDVVNVLRSIGACDCSALFVHTDIMFGLPNPALGRRGYLEGLYDALSSVGARTLFFPAFTYSFCNGEDFDVRCSRTSMGALNEFARKLPGSWRSLDPLLSITGMGDHAPLLAGMPGRNALGPGSWFEKLHEVDGLKFLFFGAEFSQYFTYVHHIEKLAAVPYRYDQPFHGTIVDADGRPFEHTHVINTQCGGVRLRDYGELKSGLLRSGKLSSGRLGDLEVACLSEADAYEAILEVLERDEYGFAYPYDESELTREYTFGRDGRRVTHC